MGKTLSEDLRVRVIAAIDAGLSRNAATARFGVAISTAVRWARGWRETGATAPKPKGGDLRSHRIEAHRAAIFAARCEARHHAGRALAATMSVFAVASGRPSAG
jgi:transposase